MCGEIFNDHFIANCPQNAPVKKIENRLIFGEDIGLGNHKVGRFYINLFRTQCTLRVDPFCTPKCSFHMWTLVAQCPNFFDLMG